MTLLHFLLFFFLFVLFVFLLLIFIFIIFVSLDVGHIDVLHAMDVEEAVRLQKVYAALVNFAMNLKDSGQLLDIFHH